MASNDQKKTGTASSVRDGVIDAALTLAAEQGWNSVSFEEILSHAEVEKSDVIEFFDGKTDILVAYGRRLDKKTLENFENDADLEHRERLFDLLMERFDHLNDDKDALLSILSSIKFNPKEALISLPHLSKSMARMLDAAGIESDGFTGCARITGLMAIYLYAVKVWKEDDSADMAKTMAALDKGLMYGEETANSLQDGNILGLFGSLKGFLKRDA